MDPTELPFTQPKFPPMNESGTDFPESQSPVPCPNPADLDELFSEEHGQLLSLSGLRTSESLLLQELDAYAPKNADGTTQIPWSQRDFVDIDESIWFKVFRREKWTNYDLAIPGFSENKFDVDDEFFWGRLRRSIELANRMLGEALRHTWLASFLTKSSREARESVSTTTDGKRHPNSTIYRVVPVPPDARQSVEAATAVLDEISEHVFWGFHHRNEYPDVLGKTLAVPWEGGKTLYWCTLDVVMLRGLIAGDTPWDGEGRQAAFNVAVIMLHELMHAISKHLLLEITNKQADRCRCWELFFDEERWAEAGISFEMSFFGTCLRNAWPLSRSPRHAFQALRGPHPWMNGQFQYYGGWSFDDPFVEDKFGLPGSIPVAMSTKDFWECQVRKFGAESLRLDRGAVTVAGFEFGKMRGVRTGRAKLLEGGGMEETEMIAERIRLRRLKLRELRPWYATEYAKWCETPFAERQLRTLLASLQRLCVGRSVKHESGILAIIPKLIFPFVTTSDLRTATTNDERISRWFFRAVGYLVLATLPVRKVVETWIEQTVPEYPDRLRPSRDFAGPPGFLEAVTEKGRKKKDKQRTKTIGVHGRAVHDRELCLANARFAFLKWRMCGVVCAELAKEFESELRAMRVRLDMRPLDNVWMEFDFRMPEYEGTVYYPPGLESKEKTHHDEQDADMPSWAIASTGIAIRVRQDDVMRYFTPAEIGDHQGLQSKVKWVLHPSPDGLEVDVYDAGDFLPNNTWDAASRARIVVPGPEGQPAGRVLRPGVLGQGQIKELISKPPLGRAMLWRREEDVRINDGREGRPKWISVGADVFDVTNLQLPPYMHELGQMLSCASGGNPVAQAIDRGYHPDLILEHLRQYQIGWVRDEVSGPRRKDRIFTADEVRWHAFPEVGMYLIIHDRVYDFTEYCGMHPGGKAILEEFAGRDATAAWNQAHAHNQSDFGIDIHAGLDMLCIGRVVPGQSDKQELSASQIRIRDLIFSRDSKYLLGITALNPTITNETVQNSLLNKLFFWTLWQTTGEAIAHHLSKSKNYTLPL
ncbi:cytochrome b5-like heme steroid binding domain-containing protein [Colletotrichum truncatum]|uniref:Cytochrome b5-like heme steroid binding domain-containing protein n=1 Tax=Colletotrichum truncatum TaxID=5467 RepID=A0ACC3ZKY2_COLTU|nr:cytochrome b5-like heme steroid binding domain-containing protein [Colletotrichum truncatum]KAF6786880.1 cytochrome b5-like heme steroid binding domain-containing protein [Colletotrichum truncatum]